MNAKLLIDAVVRQTTVLVAHLATSAGLRAPLGHIANSVFLELSSELSAQGVSRKVQADMFGMALRTYQSKIQRLSASQDDENQPLWAAVFEFIQSEEVASQAQVLRQFYGEDESMVRSILWDLCESGLVFQKGRGTGTIYRLASDEELEKVARSDAEAAALPMIWLNIYLHGPVTRGDLEGLVELEPELVEKALIALVEDVRVARDDSAEEPVYSCEQLVIPINDPIGWETAFFDHFNAVVTAACIKLRNARLRSLPSDVVGGSTYSFEIWEGHPHGERVLGLLRNFREDLSVLRQEVDEYNLEHKRDDEETKKVTFYLGQSVIE